MALPEEILDELLSAHLDGALGGDERARVERMLESDPAVQARFESLKSQSDLISQAAYSGPGLSRDFADQVVAAAIEVATEEGCSAEHPLRLAEKADGSSRYSMPQLVGFVSVLAASLLLVALLVQGNGSGSSGPSIAKSSNEDGVAEEQDSLSPESITGGNPLASNEPNSLSDPATALEPRALEAGGDETARPMVENIAENSTESNPEPNLAPDSGSAATTGMVASKSNRSLKLLLMIDVRQTDLGREEGAVDLAMESVEIVSGEEQTIEEPLVVAIAKTRAARNEPPVDEKEERVLLLRAPLEKLDRLVNELVSDRDGISGVRFTLINEGPLLRSVQSVLLDPKQASYWQVVGESEETFDLWREELGDQPFAPWPRGTQMGPLAGGASPVDMADLLLLVR